MKKKLYIILPILFLSISIFLLYQTRSARNEHRLESEASGSAELSAFEQLQIPFRNRLKFSAKICQGSHAACP